MTSRQTGFFFKNINLAFLKCCSFSFSTASILEQEINQPKSNILATNVDLETGRVSQLKDGIITILGLSTLKAGEIVYILSSQSYSETISRVEKFEESEEFTKVTMEEDQVSEELSEEEDQVSEELSEEEDQASEELSEEEDQASEELSEEEDQASEDILKDVDVDQVSEEIFKEENQASEETFEELPNETLGVSYVRALVLNLNENNSQGILLGSERLVSEGALVFRSEALFKLGCSLSLFGQVLDGLGENKLNVGVKPVELHSLVEQKATGIIDREPVRIPLRTGLKSVDSLVPIGRGQRELIIGDRQTGKTSVSLDIILNHVLLNAQYKFLFQAAGINNLRQIVWFVYNAIGQKQSTVNQVKATLAKNNADWFTAIIASTAAESAPLQFLSPYTACTLGEYIRDIIGGHCTVIFDDLSKHAVAYRQMSLLLRRPPGREAFPGDVFYVHSRLLERAGALLTTKEYVRGTLTAFPVIETQAGDVSAYIPTNVISITDGQIFLETELFYRGIRPAVNVGLSVSRVGSAAQPGIMKRIAGSLKMELAQYREIEGFSKLGASLDEQTQRLLNRGENLIEILKQTLNQPLTTLEEVFSIYLGVGYNGSWLFDIQKLTKSIQNKEISGLCLLSQTRNKMSWLEWFRSLSVDFNLFSVIPFISQLLFFITKLGLVKLHLNISAETTLLRQLKLFPGVFFDDLLFSFFSEHSYIVNQQDQTFSFMQNVSLQKLRIKKSISNLEFQLTHAAEIVQNTTTNNVTLFELVLSLFKQALIAKEKTVVFLLDFCFVLNAFVLVNDFNAGNAYFLLKDFSVPHVSNVLENPNEPEIEQLFCYSEYFLEALESQERDDAKDEEEPLISNDDSNFDEIEKDTKEYFILSQFEAMSSFFLGILGFVKNYDYVDIAV